MLLPSPIAERVLATTSAAHLALVPLGGLKSSMFTGSGSVVESTLKTHEHFAIAQNRPTKTYSLTAV